MHNLKKYFAGLVFLLFLFYGEESNSNGNYRVDYKVSEEVDGDLISVDSLIRIGREYLYLQPETSHIAAKTALRKAEEENRELWQIRALNLLGSIHEVQSAHDSALYYFFQAQTLSANIENYEQLGNSCNNIGVTYWSIGNYKDALINFFQALEYYDLGGFEGYKANTLNNIGLIYVDLDNFKKAQNYYWQAFSTYEEIGDSIRMGAALTNIGTSYLHLEMPDSALHYLYTSRDLKQLTRDKYGLCISLEGLGNAYLETGKHEKARGFFEKSKAIAEEVGFDNGRASAYLGLAAVGFQKGEPFEALKNAEKAIRIAKVTANTKMQYKAHNIISSIYDEAGKHKESLEHYRIYNELKSKTINENRLHQVYNLELQHAAEKNLREIEKQELLLSRKNTMLVFVSISFVAVLIIVFLSYRLHLNKIRQRERSKLDAANIRMTEERARAALEAEVTERKRLGFELHDGVGPLLSLAKLNVTALLQKENLSQERKKLILVNTEGTINEVLKEMKQISNNMAPLVLLEKGFEEAVKDLIRKLDQTSTYRVSVEMIGLNGKMEPYVEHALFRSIQEVLNNIMRHAHGSEINIQVIQTIEDLTIMIEDNGKGFDPDIINVKKGIGLKSAVSRIEGLKGDFYIDSAPGRGTIVTIIVPFLKKA